MTIPKLSREQQQVAVLGAAGLVIVGLLLWFYGGALLPRPTGELVIPPAPARISLPPVANEEALYTRKDFEALKRFGSVPVVPTGPGGSSDPFAAAAIGE